MKALCLALFLVLGFAVVVALGTATELADDSPLPGPICLPDNRTPECLKQWAPPVPPANPAGDAFQM